MKKYILLNILFISCFTIARAQSNLLDPTFGSKGIVTTDMGAAFNYSSYGDQVLVQPDGTMYFVMETNGSTVIAKKLANGSPDPSYGNNGLSDAVAFNGSHGALQADGKVIIGGSVLDNSNSYNPSNFAVARFNTNGRLDSGFNGIGIHVLDLGNSDIINAIAIQQDGKIVVAGYSLDLDDGSPNTLALARFNSDGSIDNTFNGAGYVETNFSPGSKSRVSALSLQTDGKIVLGGWITDQYYQGGTGVIRYNTDGSLDSSLNGTGFYIIDSFVNYSDINSIAIQNDGKIVAGLLSNGNSNPGFSICRININGGLDSSFDSNGLQTISFGGNAQQNSITLQNDGKIILAGYVMNGSDSDFAVARLNTDGSPDNTFNSNGKSITDFGGSNDVVNSITIQNDGKLVALGYASTAVNTHIGAARYNTDGSIDNTFSSNGLLIDSANMGNTYYTSSAVQADRKLLVAGYTWNGSNYDFALARYNTNGSLDETFSGDGKQTTDFGLSDDKAVALAIQTDGKIVVAGASVNSLELARYNTDGTPDNSFGGGGLDTTQFSTTDFVTSMIIQADGKIVVGGSALWRYNSNGTPDLTFGINGKMASPFSDGTPFNCGAVTLQKDGKIVIPGNNSYGSIIARYNTDASPDSTFGTDGESIIYYYTNPRVNGKSIAVASDGKIVTGGYARLGLKGVNGYQFAVARLNPDGSPDLSFGTGADGDGLIFTSPAPDILYYGTSLVIQSDNKIIMGGYSFDGANDDFTIVRYNTDGSLDNTFSGDGLEITRAGTSHNRIGSLSLDDDRLYAVGFGQYPDNLGVVARYLLSTGGALPVSLTNFTATLKNTSVLLQWQTASEQNLSYFMIERSADGLNFSPIANVAARGNANSKMDYSTVDQQPLAGINYYRLKIFDTDGKFTYSKIASVNVASQLALQIFPNPVSNTLFIQANGNNEKALLEIEDIMGRKLKRMPVTLNGNTSFSIDIHNLPAGIYNLVLYKSNKTEIQKFIKD